MQNHIEKEAKILEVNKAQVVRRLDKLGAKKILDVVTVIETYDIKKSYLFKKNRSSEIHKRFLPILKNVKSLTKEKQSLLSQGAYLRLRQEGSHSELVLKYNEGYKNDRVKFEREISVEIKDEKDWKSVQRLLQQYGLKKIFYQEKQRVSYLYKPLSLRFDIDTWPGIPTYIEIEGKSQNAIEKGARLLGYQASDLRSYKAKDVFKKYSLSPVYLSFKKALELRTFGRGI
jgi:adenylate cyclase class IV